MATEDYNLIYDLAQIAVTLGVVGGMIYFDFFWKRKERKEMLDRARQGEERAKQLVEEVDREVKSVYERIDRSLGRIGRKTEEMRKSRLARGQPVRRPIPSPLSYHSLEEVTGPIYFWRGSSFYAGKEKIRPLKI